MKSKKDSTKFTMNDFEKGLMLAGYITPSSILEIRELEALEQYEKALKKDNQRTFFKRVILAAEIATQLHEEPTFGRIKFQKLMYLCEHAAGMKLNERYTKQAAGPFDNKFMHSIANEFKTKRWFEVINIKEGTITRSIYKPLDNIGSYKDYYESNFRDSKEAVSSIINLFRKRKTDDAEIAATIHFCLIELIEEKKVINDENLLTKFYNWSDKKRRFSEEKIFKIRDWMIENGITPKL